MLWTLRKKAELKCHLVHYDSHNQVISVSYAFLTTQDRLLNEAQVNRHACIHYIMNPTSYYDNHDVVVLFVQGYLTLHIICQWCGQSQSATSVGMSSWIISRVCKQSIWILQIAEYHTECWKGIKVQRWVKITNTFYEDKRSTSPQSGTTQR